MELFALALLAGTISVVLYTAAKHIMDTKEALRKAEAEARYWKGCVDLYRVLIGSEETQIVDAYENYIDKLFVTKIKK